MNIIKHNAFMLTTSKILDASQTFSSMILNYVRTGKVGLSSLVMRKGANV